MKVTERVRESAGAPVFICDFSPPRGSGPAYVESASTLDADFICVAYNPGKAVRVDSVAMAHAVAKLYWETGANLGDMAILQQVAEGCGLKWAELAPHLESGHYRERVLQQHQEAQEQGVGGTPTYLIGGQLIPGDVSVEDLKAASRKAASAQG